MPAPPEPGHRAHPHPRPDRRQGALGAALGLLAVGLFSLTLPATRVALEVLPPGLVGPGRAAGAALMAALVAGLAAVLAAARTRRRGLAGHRQDATTRRQGRAAHRRGAPVAAPAARLLVWPSRDCWPAVLLVAFGTVTVFPWLSTLAVTRLPAAHGAVLLGLLPLLTSGFATWWAGERPSARFWLAALAGSGVVIGFAARMGGGKPQPADLLMLAAIVAAAAGHAEGGRLARRYGGFLPIAWGLWVALPVTLAATWLVPSGPRPASPAAATAAAQVEFTAVVPAESIATAPADATVAVPAGSTVAAPAEAAALAPTDESAAAPEPAASRTVAAGAEPGAPAAASGASRAAASVPGRGLAGTGPEPSAASPTLPTLVQGPAEPSATPPPSGANPPPAMTKPSATASPPATDQRLTTAPPPAPDRPAPPDPHIPLDRTLLAWLAWVYISGVTQLAGFVLWYRAMALAGVARTSQLQLLQPFLTLLAARLGLGEPVEAVTVLAALAVAAVVAAGRRAPVARAPETPAKGEARLLAKG